MSVKRLTSNWHLHLIERVLGHIIRVQLVHLPNDQIYVRLLRFREQQEFSTANGLKTRQAKKRGLEHFEARTLEGREVEKGGRERFGDCVNAEVTLSIEEQQRRNWNKAKERPTRGTCRQGQGSRSRKVCSGRC